MLDEIDTSVMNTLEKIDPAKVEEMDRQARLAEERANKVIDSSGDDQPNAPSKTIKKSDEETIGRNDPCHCGSGKKFKKCHGA